MWKRILLFTIIKISLVLRYQRVECWNQAPFEIIPAVPMCRSHAENLLLRKTETAPLCSKVEQTFTQDLPGRRLSGGFRLFLLVVCVCLFLGLSSCQRKPSSISAQPLVKKVIFNNLWLTLLMTALDFPLPSFISLCCQYKTQTEIE